MCVLDHHIKTTSTNTPITYTFFRSLILSTNPCCVYLDFESKQPSNPYVVPFDVEQLPQVIYDVQGQPKKFI